MRDKQNMARAIVRDPEIMHGTPVFRGTRVPAQTLFGYIEGGETLEDFLDGSPTVSRDLALQALKEEHPRGWRIVISQELRAFREWFIEYDAEAWERQFESDVHNGKLDELATRALRDHKMGQASDL
jgi:uncharacterized protein (DUF433 family)